jgi:ABC-2 type transport system ATP-binding protein
MPAITVENLGKRYGGVEAVRDISFSVGDGEVVAILGPNGAGKTTTVEILEGFRSPTTGTVRVLGQDPAAPGRDFRDRVGVVLQHSDPEPYLCVGELIDMFRGYYRRPLGTAELLGLVGLTDQARLRVRRLSGGQRRRLDLALALAGDPDLVFLDEPTTGFDPEARRAAWEAIRSLAALGKTIVLTTHYLDEAEALADRVLVLSDGRVVAEGTPASLGGRDHQGMRARFSPPPGVAATDVPLPVVVDGGRWTVGITGTKQLNTLTAWAVKRRVELDDLELLRPSLEDIYLELTR